MEEEEEESSGVSTPPLWRTSPHTSPHNSPHTSPHHRQNHYRCLSPKSKAQAIARGQRELMEMVSRMPESCYELSLKDIVEKPMVETRQEKLVQDGKTFDENTRRAGAMENKRNDKNSQMKRSGSVENGGFLLKMAFPASLGSKKTKKKVDSSTGKVSPRPSVSDGSAKGGENEWWKKRFSASVSESESGEYSTTNSGSTKSTGSSSGSSSSNNSRYILMEDFDELHIIVLI